MVERKLRPAPSTLHLLPSRKPARIGPSQSTKLFVLDTNVLMHDPTSLFRFEEHDIYLPILTLEELDAHKKGMTEVARNARQASRFLDELVTMHAEPGTAGIAQGIPLAEKSGGAATGRLFLQTEAIATTLPASLANGKADNQIIAVVMHLSRQHPKRSVILVSKDINMRIKARALGIAAEDYFNDKVLEDTELLYSGHPRAAGRLLGPPRQGHGILAAGRPHLLPPERAAGAIAARQRVPVPRAGRRSAVPRDRARTSRARAPCCRRSRITRTSKNNVWGIMARNREQNFALNLLMNPDIDFVTLLGQAGTGKTLLTLAAGLMQTLEFKVYTEIIMTRVTVPVGEDIGFLPGTEEEKMTSVDGRAGGQPRRAEQDRRRGRRLGPRRDARPDPLAGSR